MEMISKSETVVTNNVIFIHFGNENDTSTRVFVAIIYLDACHSSWNVSYSTWMPRWLRSTQHSVTDNFYAIEKRKQIGYIL